MADALGNVVTGAIATTAVSTTYFDPSGLVWQLDVETLAVSPALPSRVYRVFESVNCSGTAFFVANSTPFAPSPRVTFTGFEGIDATTIRVRNDSAPLRSIQVCSVAIGNGGCQVNQPCPGPRTDAIRVDETTVVTPAAIVAVAPLHPVAL